MMRLEKSLVIQSLLNGKIEVSQVPKKEPLPKYKAPKRPVGRPKVEKSTFEKVLTSPTTKQIGRTLAREFTRGILGVLGLGGTTRRR
jgi:hypothetical protein